MSGLTALGARKILDFLLRGVSPTVAGTVYLRLLTTPSTKTSSGTETNFGGWARIPLVRGTGLFTDPALTSRSTNVGTLQTGPPTSLGDDIIAFDIVNTASGAFTETYLFGNVVPRVTVVLNKAITFPPGSLVVTA